MTNLPSVGRQPRWHRLVMSGASWRSTHAACIRPLTRLSIVSSIDVCMIFFSWLSG